MDDFESDQLSLQPRRAIDHRQVLPMSLAAGLAAAVRPVVAETATTTDSVGLEAAKVRIPTSDGELPAYRAMPASRGKDLPIRGLSGGAACLPFRLSPELSAGGRRGRVGPHACLAAHPWCRVRHGPRSKFLEYLVIDRVKDALAPGGFRRARPCISGRLGGN